MDINIIEAIFDGIHRLDNHGCDYLSHPLIISVHDLAIIYRDGVKPEGRRFWAICCKQ